MTGPDDASAAAGPESRPAYPTGYASSHRHIVLVAVGAAPGAGLVAGITALRRAGHRVSLLCTREPVAEVRAAIETPGAAGDQGHNAGTVLLSPGRLPARQVRLSKLRFSPARLPAARRLAGLLGSSSESRSGSRSSGPSGFGTGEPPDVLVSVDADALPAVWLAARRSETVRALSGLPAAVARYGRSRP